jgi:hypothetical protein
MGDQVIVELTTLMVFNCTMHRLPLVAYEAPVRSGLILAPIFLIREDFLSPIGGVAIWQIIELEATNRQF